MMYFVRENQMKDWREICVAFAKKINATLLFVNDTSCGVELKDGTFKHIYIDELQEYLKDVINA